MSEEATKDPQTSTPDLPQGYRLTELGPLPEEWRVVRLGEVAHVSSGGPAPQGSAYFGGSHPFVRVQHLDEDGYLVRRSEFITDEAVHKYRLKPFPPGTIVFPKSGASIRLEKRGVLAQQSFLVSHLCAVTPDKKIVDGAFLFFALKAVRFAADKAGGYPTLTLKEIKHRGIPLPLLPEQRAIAYVLRTVQEAKEKTEQVIAAATELKKSLMRHLFTYGPVPVGQVNQVPLKDTEIGPIPEHWRVVRLGEAARHWRKTLNPQSFPEKSFEYYSIPGYQSSQQPSMELGRKIRSQKTVIQAGMVLFGKLNPRVPKIWLVKSKTSSQKIASTEFIALAPIRNTITSEYLYYLAWSYHILPKSQEIVSGSTPSRQRVDVRRFMQFVIPLPPLPEQREIARILQTVDRKIEAEENRKAALEALFKSLLHDLMTARRRLPKDFVERFRESEGA